MSKSLAQRVVSWTILGNVVLALIKIVAGISADSSALVAEAVHSVGDIIVSLAVLFTFRLAGKAADERHHFGHEKIESFCTCLMGLLLVYIGYEFTMSALAGLKAGSPETPGLAALYVTVACIFIKEGMYRYTISAACKTGSRLLYADAWHHRVDMLILTGVLIGVAGARMGYPVLESIVALAISVLIIRLGIGFCRHGLGDLVDTAPNEAEIARIRTLIAAQEGVLRVDCIRARQAGSAICLEIHIGVAAELCVSEGHDVGKAVKNALISSFPAVGHVLIHINPVKER
ncbi:MAG: cation transporter [Dethiobacter sp.]|jgi:cation diffusion facilitator family transporter|nr:cation transporter [Dethiobacter sp.]MBS3900704.1 cation transporter [Dethiobacter sp.]